jgi:hypothetical protein
MRIARYPWSLAPGRNTDRRVSVPPKGPGLIELDEEMVEIDLN